MKFELTIKAAIITYTLFLSIIFLISGHFITNTESPQLFKFLTLSTGIILGILSAPHIKIWNFKKNIDEKNPAST